MEDSLFDVLAARIELLASTSLQLSKRVLGEPPALASAKAQLIEVHVPPDPIVLLGDNKMPMPVSCTLNRAICLMVERRVLLSESVAGLCARLSDRARSNSFRKRELAIDDEHDARSPVLILVCKNTAIAKVFAHLYNSHKTVGARGWFGFALKTAGILNFRWHDLQHTFASRLVMAGMDIRPFKS